MVESHRKSEGPPGGTLAFSIHRERDRAGRGEQLPAPLRPPGASRRRGVFRVAGTISVGRGLFSLGSPCPEL
jgi:hypothetical protein